MKRLLILFLAILLLSGCGAENDSTPLRDYYPLQLSYDKSFFYEDMGWAYDRRDRDKDDALQQAAAQISVEYPLSTPEQIRIYAAALREFCVTWGDFPAEFSVVDVLQFRGDIWLLCFTSEESRLYDMPAPTAYVLISGVDGHILYRHYDETGTEAAAEIARRLRDMVCLMGGTDFVAHRPEERFDDPQLQKMAARIQVEYPITTEDQIKEYAWALYESCMADARFASQFMPHFAQLTEDGVLHLSFSDAGFLPEGWLRFDGEAVIFWVSPEDGHIIDMAME